MKVKVKAKQAFPLAVDGIGHDIKNVAEDEIIEVSIKTAQSLIEGGLCDAIETKKVKAAPENKAIKAAPSNKKAAKKAPSKKGK